MLNEMGQILSVLGLEQNLGRAADTEPGQGRQRLVLAIAAANLGKSIDQPAFKHDA